MGFVVVPAVKVPSAWHCRQMASEELCTHTPTAPAAAGLWNAVQPLLQIGPGTAGKVITE